MAAFRPAARGFTTCFKGLENSDRQVPSCAKMAALDARRM
jgi:hypothetical protein